VREARLWHARFLLTPIPLCEQARHFELVALARFLGRLDARLRFRLDLLELVLREHSPHLRSVARQVPPVKLVALKFGDHHPAEALHPEHSLHVATLSWRVNLLVFARDARPTAVNQLPVHPQIKVDLRGERIATSMSLGLHDRAALARTAR
jgi:hypothetical protein